MNISRISLTLTAAAAMWLSLPAMAEVESRISVSPAPGEVSALSNTYVISPVAGATITKGTSTEAITMSYLAEGDTRTDITMSASVIGGAMRINFPLDIELPTAPGQYSVIIPEGRFAVDGEENEALELIYTIPSTETPDEPDEPVSPETPAIIMTPAPGEVAEVGAWQIGFNCQWELLDRTSKFTVTGPEGVDIPSLRSKSAQTEYLVYFADDVMLTVPGTYSITIPAGKFLLDPDGAAISNDEVTYLYTILNASDLYTGECVVTPTPGTHVQQVDAFAISYPDAATVVLADASAITLTDYLGVSLPVEVSVSGNTVAVTTTAVTTPATYTLAVGQGAIVVDGKPCSQLSAKYIIDAPTTHWTGTYTVSPADGSEVDAIESVELKFGAKDKVVVDEYASPSDFPALYDAAGTLIIRGFVYAEDNLLYTSISGGYRVPGTYRWVIPAKLVTINGLHPAEDISLSYTVKSSASEAAYTYTVTPAAGGVLGLDENVTIQFAGDDVVSVSHDSFAWGSSAPHFTSADGYWCPALQIQGSGLTYTLSHTWPFETAGEYVLVIPAGYFTVNTADGGTVPCEGISVVYNVTDSSHIIDIVGDGGTYDVYTITGIRVDADVRALPAGIYVINGRKVVIR